VSQQLSDLGLELRSHRKQRPRRGRGCLAVLIALAVLVGAGYAAYTVGFTRLQKLMSPPPDYSGTGTGSVIVEVKQGDAATDIAATLVKKDVVKSAEAFTDAAKQNPESVGIQVGFYQLKHKMSAKSALKVLIDPKNLMQSAVTFPEGWTAARVVDELVKKTDFSRADYLKVLKHPGSIGLPGYAKGNPEGYLFPATYMVPPNATPTSILKQMVDRYKQEAAGLGLPKKARELGYSPHDVMTVASLVQAEARFDKDFPKVARVIYNRLQKNMPLQFDSTVHYAVGRDGSVGTSNTDRASTSPYNTYKYPGLPPTPIAAPGEKALRAALEPADGSWLYFVTTNPDTGVTKFATSYSQHLKNKAEFEKWCQQSDHC
jgi:UPF0755 protein